MLPERYALEVHQHDRGRGGGPGGATIESSGCAESATLADVGKLGYRYHTEQLEADGHPIAGNFANSPEVVPNEADRIAATLTERS